MTDASTLAEAPPADAEVADAQEWPYKFAVLPIGQMFADESYQRPLTKFAEKMAEKFNPALVGTLVVSDRGEEAGDQRYALVDGQTRAKAASIREVEELPCLVYMGMSVAQEAALFADLQKERRGVASYHRFRAALVAGDPEATGIQRIVTDCGYTTGTNNPGNNAISAVAALEKVYRKDPVLLERTLLVLQESYRDRLTPSGDLIGGLADYLARKPNVDDERLANRLSTSSIDEIKRRALALREGSSGVGVVKYWSQAIEGIYNKRGN